MRLGERAETCLQRCPRAARQQEGCQKRGSRRLGIVTLNLLTYQMGINLTPWGYCAAEIKEEETKNFRIRRAAEAESTVQSSD